MRIKVVTQNVAAYDSRAEKRSTLAAVRKENPHVALLQEGGALWNSMDLFTGYDAWRSKDAGLPILYRDAQPTALGWWEAYPETRVGRWGAGPAVLKSGVDAFVRVYGVLFVDAHLAPSVTRRRPVDLAAREGWEKRRRLYRLEVEQLCDMTAGSHDVVIAGDFNAEWGHELMRPLARAGFKSWSRPTHGRRSIDQFLVRGDVRVVGLRDVNTASDHDMLVAVMEL